MRDRQSVGRVSSSSSLGMLAAGWLSLVCSTCGGTTNDARDPAATDQPMVELAPAPTPRAEADEPASELPESEAPSRAPRSIDPASCAPDAVSEGDLTRARASFQRGISLFQEADYQAAALEFEAAYSASCKLPILFNIARAYQQLGESDRAVRLLEDALAATEGEDQRQQLRELLKRLRRD